MANLRLDIKDEVFAARRRSATVVPGKPGESLLYQRLTAKQPALRMPPASSHKTLTNEQIETFRKWIEQGAEWQEHWAFRAPVKPEAPQVRTAGWAENPIDRFLLARLEAEGLKPAPEADKRTLIRRVALDATGLPPKPLEVEQFLKDTAPGAYERMVDRYLASPHYGEHRARYWLDAARYADTHGIHIDNYREIWPYRDWVIDAYNRNLPFDRFTIEQLAGDLLPNATLEQRIATGFQRCNATTSEGGAIDDEYYEIYAKDRADTTGAVWLGMTVGCATCHDHKFDPISQKDFYALGAYFRNTPQKAMDGNIADTPPIMLVPPEEDRERWTEVNARVSKLRGELRQLRGTPGAAFDVWLKGLDGQKPESPLEGESWAAEFEKVEASDVVQRGDAFVPGQPTVHFLTDEGVNVEDPPELDAGKPFALSAIFYLPEKQDRDYVVAAHQNSKERGRGWVLQVVRGLASFRLIGDGGRGIEARAVSERSLKPGAWNHVAVSYDGSREHLALTLWANGREVMTQGRGTAAQELSGSIAVEGDLTLGRRLQGGGIADLRLFHRELQEADVAVLGVWPAIQSGFKKRGVGLEPQERSAMLAWYLTREDTGYGKLAASLHEANEDASEIARRSAVTHVMYELPDSEPHAHILHRGAYDQKGKRVEAATPSILPPMPASLPNNRLGFAKWLFLPEHPLTARVTVNRMWQEIFGTGLVKTPDDFGSQGEPPSHPELLDWLAVDFREGGWDMKRFYKQIFLSAAYKQSAEVTEEKLAKDPENRLLSRGPRFRMDAEMVRDYALAASGMLARGIGGPSVKPYQPDGVWEAVAMVGSNTRFYKRDSGQDLYRRSLYTFWKRSAPPASMDIFNAPTRENCTVRRERTNTPLQALVTMNDTQFVEAARVLAERAMGDSLDYGKRVDTIAQSILLRPLSAPERRIVDAAFKDYKAYYEENAADAAKFLKTGERHADPTFPRAEYAAFTMVANQIFNLDEVLNK